MPGANGIASAPPAAIWLGVMGLLPFVALAAASVVSEPPPLAHVAFALTAYGAAILSFLGGIHWGLAIGGYGSERGHGAPFRRLGVSVLPSMLGWAALLLPLSAGLYLLAAGFSLLLLYDLRASRTGQAPPWYPSLRLPLTLAVVVALLVAALGQ
jgi:hypothetical protein